MSGETPPAKPAESAKPAGGGGGDKKPPANPLGNAWGFAILGIVVIFSGVIATLGEQIGYLFQIMKQNLGPILGIMAAIFFLKPKK